MFEKTVKEPGKRLDARLDAWLAKNEPDHSRARWQALIREKWVTVNGEPVKPNFKLRGGDRVQWTIPPPVSSEVLAEDIPLNILYEDGQIIVINKPAGLVVHPAPGNENGTLVNALLHHCQDLAGIGGEKRPGIVHRLDKDTSGVMVVAKTEKAMVELSRQFKKRETEKEYMAIVRGVPNPPAGVVSARIGRHRIHRKKMTVDEKRGRRAVSIYKVVEAFQYASLIKVRIETGRTHQIRVHMASLRHPILGDKLYAQRAAEVWPERQMLHAAKLSITHPNDGNKLSFTAPLPPDMEALLEKLRSKQSPKGPVKRDRV